MLKFLLICLSGALVIYFLYPSPPEAREWLAKNNNPYALAGNRFFGTEDAKTFVESLYALGAVKVQIPRDAIYSDKKRIEEEGGPYADALLVTLPRSQTEIEALFEVFRAEASRQGMVFNSEEDVRNNKALLWWD
ncbi:hypothetical protein [Arsukibacterium sp.]|uniref:hypothetical protein n=1 Tax=Arsukibacterium sp. TaxID=1977258 RepID=UPI002FD9210B